MNISIKRALQSFNGNTKKQAIIGAAITTAVFALGQVPCVGNLLASVAAIPLIGYFLKFAAQQINSIESTDLPEWNDVSKLIVDALRTIFLTAIQFVLLVALPISFAIAAAIITTATLGFKAGLLVAGLTFLSTLLVLGLPWAVLAQCSFLRFAATDSFSKALNIFSLIHFGLREFFPILCVSLVWCVLGAIAVSTELIDNTVIALVLSPVIGTLQFCLATVSTSLWAQAYAPFNEYERAKLQANSATISE